VTKIGIRSSIISIALAIIVPKLVGEPVGKLEKVKAEETSARVMNNTPIDIKNNLVLLLIVI